MENLIESVKIESNQNSLCKTFHARAILVDKNSWYSTEYKHDREEFLCNASPLTIAIVDGINNINGVLSVSVKPYNISVNISPAYSWDEIFPQIALILSKYLPVEYNCFNAN